MLSPSQAAAHCLAVLVIGGLALAGCGDRGADRPAAQDQALAPAPGSPTAAVVDAPTARGGAGAHAQPAPRDWRQTVVATPEGGFRMGNPQARVQLVEFASFTCGHCRDFHIQSASALKDGYVARGLVAYEFRPFFLNPFDMAATLMATCQGPAQFFAWTDQLFRQQDNWVEPFTRVSQSELAAVDRQPENRRILALAELGGLGEWARARGLPRARFEACLADKARLQGFLAQQQAATQRHGINATPSFLINGRRVENVSNWAQLQPRLAQALR